MRGLIGAGPGLAGTETGTRGVGRDLPEMEEVGRLSTTQWIILIAAVVVVVIVAALVAWSLARSRRRQQLRQQFGPEYDRTVEDTGKQSAADRVLAERAARHESFNLRALQPEERTTFTRQWNDVQAMFVDNPRAAVSQADTLVQLVMARRGYPTNKHFDERAGDLSVEHSDVIGDYRKAHDLATLAAADRASTEDMRQSVTLYRSLFAALLDSNDGNPESQNMASSPNQDVRRTG